AGRERDPAGGGAARAGDQPDQGLLHGAGSDRADPAPWPRELAPARAAAGRCAGACAGGAADARGGDEAGRAGDQRVRVARARADHRAGLRAARGGAAGGAATGRPGRPAGAGGRAAVRGTDARRTESGMNTTTRAHGRPPALATERPALAAALRSIGPGAVVVAAFIGPGTVTTATLAGARYGYTLLWALTFSLVATLVLQEMAARLGVVTREGLGEAIRARFGGRASRLAAIALILSAIAFGNAAYETGNLLGAGMGASVVLGGTTRAWALVCGGVAFVLLWTGRYRVVEIALMAMVALMSLVFIATAAVLAPPAGELLSGLVVPRLPGGDAGGLLVAVGLIGTTVVPYNLFLHAAAVRERWSGAEHL